MSCLTHLFLEVFDFQYTLPRGLPDVAVVKNPPANAGDARDVGVIPGGGHCNPLEYSCLENFMDREDWLATVHGVAKSQMQLSAHTHTHTHTHTHIHTLYYDRP